MFKVRQMCACMYAFLSSLNKLYLKFSAYFFARKYDTDLLYTEGKRK